MTPEEFATQMEEIAGPLIYPTISGEPYRDCGDAESSHGNADILIANLLRELGYSAGVDIYDQMVRWCA